MKKGQQLLRRTLVLFVASLLIYILSYSDITVETIYSEGLYPLTSSIQRFLSKLLPFALGDFLYLLLILYALRALYRFFSKTFKKGLKKEDLAWVPLQIINCSLILYLLFKLLWGLNYSRPSISTRLGIRNEKYTTPELVQLGSYFIKQLNQLQHIKRMHYNLPQLRQIAKMSYDQMQKQNRFFHYPNPSVKPVLNSWIVTKIGIEGYYNPLSGEANVNMRLPDTELPFVTCHEIAHQLGIGREDEANLIGYLTAINSDNRNFRYSAAYAMLKSILFEIRIKSPEDYDRLYATINPVTIKDFQADRDFWRKYNSQMFGYMDVAFDRFLKLNNQQRGTDSYQDIVLWLYNIHKKDL